MKNIFTLLLAVCALTLTSCKDDSKTPDSLNGTKWELTMPNNAGVATFEFSEKTVKNTYPGSDGKLTDVSGTYTYLAPNVTITFNTITSKGVVNGKQMTITYDGETRTLNRK